jgi:hypothetical protein
MARARVVRPDFWGDEKIAMVSRDARLTFVGLWTVSDDYGVAKGSPKWLKSQIFPYDNITIDEFTAWLNELEELKPPVIIRFEYHGEIYYFIPKFLKHQKIDHPSKTRNPEPPAEIIETLAKHSRGLAKHSL